MGTSLVYKIVGYSNILVIFIWEKYPSYAIIHTINLNFKKEIGECVAMF
jgi:hypothetical protein